MATIPIVAAVKDFDKLTRELAAAKEAAKAARAEAKGLKENLEEAGKAGHLKKMAVEAGQFALGLAGVASVGEVVKKIIEAAKEDFRQLLDMQKGAAEAQQTMYEATGAMVQSANLTPRQVEEWRTFAESQGAQLGKQGAVDIIRARAALGGEDMGESETVKRSVMERAVAAKAQNRNVDLNQYFTALMHMLDAFGGDLQLADNMLIASQQSGMTLETISKNIPTIKALAAETGASLPDVMTKAALIGTELGEEGTGTLRKLLMGGGGNDKSKVALAQRTLARSAEAQADIEARFAEAAAPGANLRADIGRSLAEIPGAAGIAAGRLAAGTAEVAQSADYRGVGKEHARETNAAFLKRTGIRPTTDVGTSIRPYLMAYGDQRGEEWSPEEQYRITLGEVQRRAPVATALANMRQMFGGEAPPPGETADQLMARTAAQTVSPEGGLDLYEQAALKAAGVTADRLAELIALDRRETAKEFAAAIAEVLKELQQHPAPNALNPGT